MIDAILNPLTPHEYLKVLAIPAVLLVLVIASIVGVKGCANRQAAAAAIVVAAAQGREQVTATELAKAKEELQSEHLQRMAQDELVANLQAKLDAVPKPKPHPEIPTSAKIEELKTAGITSPITGAEADLAWSWKKAAEDLPIVSSRLVATEALVDGQRAQNDALRSELATAHKVMERQVQLLNDRAEQIRGLQVQVAAGARAEKIGTVEKVLEIGAAVILGAVAGRASK